MNNIDTIKELYKPYRFTKKGEVLIINTTLGDYVLKNKKEGLKELFAYLNSRGFNNYPKMLSDNRSEYNIYEYLEDTQMPKEQRSIDLISLVSNLHHKTNYYKEVSQDKYQEIYDNIKSNIDYLKEYYDNIYDTFFKNIYHSPSQTLLLNNYYKINASLAFCESELNNWFDLVKEETRQRVAIVHNNLSLDHFIENDENYLISWDNFKVDTPVLDLVSFYKNSSLDLNFKDVLDTYLDHYPLNESEKKLFFILISIPAKIEFKQNEFNNTHELRKSLDYLFKTEELVRPYYTHEEVKE